MTRKINLGCGYMKQKGYINIDFNPECKPDILHDLRKGLPFDSNSADEIMAYDFLEHCEDFVAIMNEIARVLKVGGILRARFPPWNREGAFDFCHPIVVNYRHFKLYEPNSNKSVEYSINKEKINKCFKVLKMDTVQGKCLYCPEGKHKIPKCHVIVEKIK